MSSHTFSRMGWLCAGFALVLFSDRALADRGVNETCDNPSPKVADAGETCASEKKAEDKKREVNSVTEASHAGGGNDSPTFNHFGAGFLAGFDSTGGQSYSAQVSWFPEWRFHEPLFLRGGLHFSLQKIRGPVTSPVLSANVSLFYQYRKIEIGAGPGAQTFFENGGTKFEMNGTLGYRLDENFIVDIERLYLTYTAYFARNTIHQLVLGVGIAF